jgi:hypothetical protein
MSKINVLFNSDKYYLNPLLPVIKEKVNDLLFSSSDLLVYKTDDLEIMVNHLGNVTISTSLSRESDFGTQIMKIREEYKKLTNISEGIFQDTNDFKIVSPKEHTKKFVEQLISMNYEADVIDTIDSDTLVIH